MDAVQERQLVLMEKMNRRLDAIQEGQKKLEEANATLRNENETLRTELERQQTQKSRCGRKSRVQSTVEVPNDLRHSTIDISKLSKKGIIKSKVEQMTNIRKSSGDQGVY